MADNKTQIVITAEDKTAAAFASAKAGLEKFASAYASLGSLAGVGVVAGLVASVKHVIDLGDEMHDLSQKVGISVQDLGTWKLAAEQSGASLESVARGVKGLSQYMVQNSDKLREAGVTATDANGALIQLADLFKALPDGVEKTALAVQLFGKAGMDMIPMLNLGSAGLEESRKKAAEYSKAMAELAPQADRFNDTLRELKLQSELTALSFTNKLIEPLNKAAEAIKDARGGAEGLYSAMKKLQELTQSGPLSVFGLIAAGADIAIPRGKAYSGPKTAIGLPMSEMEQFDAATEAYMADAPARAAAAEARKKALGLLDKGAGTEKAAKPVGSVRDYAMRVNEAVAGAINTSAVVKSRELAAEIEALDKLFFDSGLDMDIYTSAMAKLTGQTDKASKEQGRLAELLNATPTAKLEETRKDMELLAGALEAGHISEEQFIEATQARLGNLGQAVKEVDNFARDMGLSFASAFEDAVIGGKSLSDVLKGLAQDIERIVLRKTVTEPMGNAISDALKGSSIGSGGLFGSIKDLFGFASGGAFTVGGAGGTDSQLVAFKATPGEEVTVRTPGQKSGGGGIVINQSISVDSRSDQASIMQAMVAAKNAAVAEIHNSMRRGGAFA